MDAVKHISTTCSRCGRGRVFVEGSVDASACECGSTAWKVNQVVTGTYGVAGKVAHADHYHPAPHDKLADPNAQMGPQYFWSMHDRLETGRWELVADYHFMPRQDFEEIRQIARKRIGADPAYANLSVVGAVKKFLEEAPKDVGAYKTWDLRHEEMSLRDQLTLSEEALGALKRVSMSQHVELQKKDAEIARLKRKLPKL